MGMLQFFKDAKNVQAMKKEMGQLKAKTQHMIDILSGTEEDDTGKYKGNEYRTYRKAINAVDRKYNGLAKWGVLQTGNIIDLRAAFIISRGIKISAREKGVDASREIKWAKNFIEYNNLDKEMVQEFAKEAEIEGKILLKIDIEKTPEIEKFKEYDYQMVAVRYVSWLDKKYTVITEKDDYLKYKEITWGAKGDQKAQSLKENQFVYKKFGGRINDPNTAQSKVMKCLTQIDNLDKALRDWREINRIFAGPILAAECKDGQDVTSTKAALNDKNWKIKKVFISTAKLYYAQFDVGGVESLENEIITLAKMISGTTGISVQYLGLVDLLKNRSTSDDMREMLSTGTVKERATWEGTYEELIVDAMNLFNETIYKQKSDSNKLNPYLIKVTIPVITKQHWANIKDVWLPAVVAGKITEELFLEQLPDVDIDEELQRREEKEQNELEQIKHENEDLKADMNNKEIFGGGA